ncbi:hypothetical protein ABT373_14875 [Streptomyces sp. NPDC000070]|uniref:hypothetical protein n=1 Tax=Streptomyces sp. NPDC000070 TaxID=3154240 RepID=UPI00332D4A6D
MLNTLPNEKAFFVGRTAELRELADALRTAVSELLTAVVADALDLSDHTPRMPVEAVCDWIGSRSIGRDLGQPPERTQELPLAEAEEIAPKHLLARGRGSAL